MGLRPTPWPSLPSLSAAYLGHQLGIGSGFGPEVLGLGNVEEDVHEIGWDVQGKSELSASVVLGLVVRHFPFGLGEGDVARDGWESPFLFLCPRVFRGVGVFFALQRDHKGPLLQDRVLRHEVFLGLGESRAEAAEDGVGVEGPARLQGGENQEKEKES